jgi:hypothetical protein|nr:hypothetical protein [Oxalobacteraceae bacterium]
MDTDDLIKYARARFDHESARRVLREKYQTKMIFGHNGGMWRASPEMITFLALYGDQDVVVPDLYDTPIKFNARVMRDIMQTKWQEQMNAWECEYQEISSQR